ncbi:M23 family metallopeptidase [Erythrobacter sp. THAF29]|uniref:M23 family metallopeptidase n=1 Tax=Erythrobacter sp. THAF29 TaxID=2587851 RepID=UPI0012A94CAC|nr:M23 family metallopeptidase [Erythrobacter sp. THAF29]QFT76348.1 Murein DD-endopeptidase MepM [Erythrobacter sp. THAF29]
MDHARDILDGRTVEDDVSPSDSVSEAPKDAVPKPRVITRTRSFGERYDEWKLAAGDWLSGLDLAPDLAENIGSRRWFRGLGTMIGLGALAFAFWPEMSPLEARSAMPQGEEIRDEFRSQMIMPLALGADSGRRMGPTERVIPLASAPERPQIELLATLAPGDSFASMLRRAGVSAGDIGQVSALIGSAMPLSEIEPGTQMDIVLGRRAAPGAPRPLTALKFRARFDLELEVGRQGVNEETGQGGSLALQRNVIRVDDTPLRVRGKVGGSLYRSMRAAGVPASAVQDYIKTLDNQIDMDREVRSSDEWDIIVAYRRAATGERQAGQLMYAGIDRGGVPRTQLMRWGKDGTFYEASGVGEQRNGLVAPVPGSISSRFGMRRHPILGYRRMHAGLDFRARRGTPIVAVTDGRVTGAGRMGGCGIAVRVNHGNGLSTRYCHMSRKAVNRGQEVRRGQVIGYVGSTGLSTGPHLHYEMYRNGRAINPASVKFVTRAQLSGTELIDFKIQLNKLKQVEPGAALEDLETLPSETEEPLREIEKIELSRRGQQVRTGP